ncbi:MAG: hypothetical protein HY909_01130, partial [Deltaproteobacteria bacterium]|nr:hypothetical protein [Deltaproteobacteria bacterium]
MRHWLGPWVLVGLGLAACDDASSVIGGMRDSGGGDTASEAASDLGTDTTAPMDTTPPDTTVQDTTPPDTAVQDTTPMDTSGCRADMDCMGNPAGGVCDTAMGRCVGCLAERDTCPASQHCDAMTRACVAGCRADEGCREGDGGVVLDAGGPRRDRCDTMAHACVECARDEHCAPGFLCVGNVCTVGCNPARPCPSGQTCCAGACVDPLTNTAHCGVCDTRCMVTNGVAACMNGACAVGSCTPPFGDCDMMAANGCETNTTTAVAHCGRCGNRCPARANAAATCAGGACGFTCNAGFADCNGSADDGCEVNLTEDPTHCGSCSTLCNPPSGTAGCAMGRCTVRSCAEGFADCDMNATNGCEVATGSSSSHCGRCGNACPARPNAFPGCVLGSCVISCVAGFADCDGDAMNGCEVDTRTDPAHCAACNRACAVPRATAACAGSRCTVGRCDPGFADCNTMAADGCEVNTLVDENHCGRCGNACVTPGGTPVCRAGTCGISACAAGREDCDRMASNGCETDTQGDASNCGGCGSACALPRATAVCSMGRCAIGRCDVGFGDCNLMAADGCEADLNTEAAHCGGCGMRCAIANGAPACMAGRCTVASCNAGFSDCNMAPGDGCEVNLNTDGAHCGACGRSCAAGLTCQAGVCTRFPSTGAEGAFNPTGSVTLTPGVHNFTTINIPSGVTVRVSGNGVLDLRAIGDVTIAGRVDVSGGNGGNGANCVCGVGGQVGTAVAGPSGGSGSACAGGGGGLGSAGGAGGT